MATLDQIIRQASKRKPRRKNKWEVYEQYKSTIAVLVSGDTDQYEQAIRRLRIAMKL